jgi:hypothetical protein
MKAAEIAAALELRKFEVLRHLLPEGRVRGDEFCVGSLGGERGDSLKVHLNGKGCLWSDFATGQSGGDLLDLWAQVRCGGNISTAKAEATDWLGLGPAKARKPNGASGPREERPPTHPKLGEPSMVFPYYSASAELIGAVCRFNLADGGKEIRPCLWRGDRWDWSAGFAKPRPLYRLPDLAARPDLPVLLVEGEKAADAAVELVGDHVAMAWPGGTAGVRHIDLAPLKGRNVVLWPDADEPGRKAMREMAELLKPLARSIRIVELPADTPAKWDLADPVPESWAEDTVERLIREARPIADDNAGGTLRVVSVADLLAMQLPPRENVLAPWLQRQGLAMIHAYRGIAKTWVGLACAVAMACGGKALKWSAPKPLRVLYLDGEMPAVVMQERLGLVLANVGHRDLAERNLQILTPDLQPGFMPNISMAEGQAALGPLLDGVDVVFVDNLATLAAVSDDNAVDQWAPAQAWALQQRREGRSVVLLHHDGKGGTQRGTSGREDVLDTVIKLRRPDGYLASEGARFEVIFEKNRGFYGADAATFEARLEHWITPDGNRVRWEIVDSDDSDEQRVVDLDAEGLSVRRIAAETGIHRSRVERLLNRARKTGRKPVSEGVSDA